MKFLCVPCDSPMKLQTVTPPDRGSLAVVYACPECGYEMAMLTNAYETQVVQSLGVRIGPGAGKAGGPTAPSAAGFASAEGAPAKAESACPFAGMVQAGEDGQARRAADPAAVRWTAAAEARLANVPAFVRPMARTGIEKFALDKGSAVVDEQMLDAAREFFGM